MLAIEMKQTLRKPVQREKQDIIVNKISTVTVYENGNEIRKRRIKKVNVTRLVNESQKLIKAKQAKEKSTEAELVDYYTNKR